MNWYEILFSLIKDCDDERLLSIINETGISFNGDWFIVKFYSNREEKQQATIKIRIYDTYIMCFLLDAEGSAQITRLINAPGIKAYDTLIKTCQSAVCDMFRENRRRNAFVAYLDYENEVFMKN